MRRSEQSQNRPRGMSRNSEWNNTDEHFSFDHDNNFDTSSKYNDYNSSYNDRRPEGHNANHGTDYSDVGMATRSHRYTTNGWDRPGMRSSNPGMHGYGEDTFMRVYTDKSGHYGKGPKGYRRSDDRIKEDVSEALYANPDIDASNIEVAVMDGTVTLTGTVDSREIKRRVESILDFVSGVDDIQNNLKVSKSSGSTTTLRNQKLA